MSRVNGEQFEGSCKFWNAVKGYGFLTDAKGGSDLFVGQAELVTGDDKFRALTPGFQVECTVEVTDGKTFGKQVKALGGGNLPSFKDKFSSKRAIELAKPADPNKKTGVVKWFNQLKKYGFIVPDSGEEKDVFFHEVACMNGIPETDDKVSYSLSTDDKGKVVAQKVQNKTRHGSNRYKRKLGQTDANTLYAYGGLKMIQTSPGHGVMAPSVPMYAQPVQQQQLVQQQLVQQQQLQQQQQQLQLQQQQQQLQLQQQQQQLQQQQLVAPSSALSKFSVAAPAQPHQHLSRVDALAPASSYDGYLRLAATPAPPQQPLALGAGGGGGGGLLPTPQEYGGPATVQSYGVPEGYQTTQAPLQEGGYVQQQQQQVVQVAAPLASEYGLAQLGGYANAGSGFQQAPPPQQHYPSY